MPMYEFLCPTCNTIYTFLSKTITTGKIPSCPKSQQHALERMISRFAFTGKTRSGSEEEGGDEGMPDFPIDESKMERAMEALASEAENINEDNPRQAADLVRKLSGMTGLKLGDKMEEALSRMEAGEDPDTIEQQMGDIGENDLFSLEGSKAGKKTRLNRKGPSRDETLYEM